MIGFDVLVLDGASASAVGVTIDVVSAANRILGKPAFDLGSSRRKATLSCEAAWSPRRNLSRTPGHEMSSSYPG